MIECYLPLDYFSNFFGVHVDTQVLEEYIERQFPELAAHFEQVGFNIEMLSLQWFVQLLVNKMPIETVNLIWDMFLLYDMTNLFRALLTAISQVHDVLLNIDRFDEVLLTLQEFIATEFTPDMLINSLVEKISVEELQECRKRHSIESLNMLQARLQRSRQIETQYEHRKQFMDNFFSLTGMQHYYEKLAEKTEEEEHKLGAQILAQPCDNYIPGLMRFYKCDPSWPICVYDFTHRNRNPKFTTLRVQQPLNSLIKDQYFSEEFIDTIQPKMKRDSRS